jgi:cytochrome c-type biogenesis protein CcmF
MLSNIGNSLILVNILIGISLIYISFNNIREKRLIIPKTLNYLTIYQTTFSIISFFVLIAGFVVSDFSLTGVYQNSHTSKPLFYKIAGTWGNHEGSLLLWINVMIIFSNLFLIYNKNAQKNYLLCTLFFQNILILGFLFFLFLNSNPFDLIIPTPKEGLGLNPILQDPALAIHPPLLYIGFVGSSIYFSAAMASLVTNYKGENFAKTIKFWVLISWSFQTLGIIVGSIWAYYELGWGGFWFWDPVENASLIPWFVMTALLHSVMVLEKRNTLYSWVIILCLSTFIFSVMGTFLVRSGILNSVHTFANDPSRGLYILLFLSIMIFTSFIIYFKKIKKDKYSFSINSKETFILINNWFMAFFLFTVLVGTIYPIFTEVLGNIKVSVGPPFYNIVIIPFIIPLVIIMAIGPNVKWIKNNSSNLFTIFILFILAIIFNTLIFYLFKSTNFFSNMIITSSIFLIFHSFLDFFKLLKKKVNLDYSRVISHLGFGLLIFFIGINHNFSIEKDFNLQVGENKTFQNYDILFNSLELENRENYKAVIGTFNITNLKTQHIEELSPEIRIFKNPETLTYEASIKSKLFNDLYITMSNVSRSEFYNIKFQKKPFMSLIWCSAILIALGGFVRLFRNEN